MSKANGTIPAAAATAERAGPAADDQQRQVEQVQVGSLTDLDQRGIVGHRSAVVRMNLVDFYRTAIVEQSVTVDNGHALRLRPRGSVASHGPPSIASRSGGGLVDDHSERQSRGDAIALRTQF